MRNTAAWGLATTLALGLGAGLSWAADDSDWAPTWQWKPFAGWFSPKTTPEEKKPVEKKPAPKTETTQAKKPITPVKPASIVEGAVARRNREEAVLLRRLRACDKLKEIAIRTNDNDLLRRAEDLEERAQATYAHEMTIDRYLDSSQSPSKDAQAYVVSSKDQSSQAAAKEVKPCEVLSFLYWSPPVPEWDA
jgi:hypothetical protein